MTTTETRMALVTGLFAVTLLIFLSGDIWVWRGSMLGELGNWVTEEGGEQAFWGATVLYSAIILLAFAISAINARWFRWLSLGLMVLLLLSTLSKTVGGLDEYAEVGWYFFVLFSIQVLIELGLVWINYRWVRAE